MATMMALSCPKSPRPPPGSCPPAEAATEDGLVGLGADLEPGTLLAAYRSGLFPMPMRGLDRIAWWSPDPRAILPLERLRVTNSLRRSRRRFELRIDTAFESVIRACANPSRRGGWIDEAMVRAYLALHEHGWAHSVEAWTAGGRLAGGLYGVGVGGLFAGESMFHRETDASKVALVELVERLPPGSLLDVQWLTPHLASLGAIEIPRAEYLRRLDVALRSPFSPIGTEI